MGASGASSGARRQGAYSHAQRRAAFNLAIHIHLSKHCTTATFCSTGQISFYAARRNVPCLAADTITASQLGAAFIAVDMSSLQSAGSRLQPEERNPLLAHREQDIRCLRRPRRERRSQRSWYKPPNPIKIILQEASRQTAMQSLPRLSFTTLFSGQGEEELTYVGNVAFAGLLSCTARQCQGKGPSSGPSFYIRLWRTPRGIATAYAAW